MKSRVTPFFSFLLPKSSSASGSRQHDRLHMERHGRRSIPQPAGSPAAFMSKLCHYVAMRRSVGRDQISMLLKVYTTRGVIVFSL